jgi:polygalacturonase
VFCRIGILSIFCSLVTGTLLKAEVLLKVTDIDSACGQPQHNCRPAFQKAFQAAAKAGGGTVQLPAGTFLV